MTLRVALCALPLLAGCLRGGPRPCSDAEGDILVLGDSILRFYSEDCASVPDRMASRLGRGVRNEAVKGAKVDASRGYWAGGLTDQYVLGSWDWVVLEGGVNDLRGSCGTADAAGLLDAIVSEDGASGAMPALVDRARADGPRVVLLGYYGLFDDAYFGFGDCNPELSELRRRYTAVAEARDGVVFVDPGTRIGPSSTPDAYRGDGIHPSEQGSRVLAELVVAAIETAEAADTP